VKEPSKESAQMCECVVERDLDYAMDAALAEANSRTVELKTKRDVFPERRDRREGHYFRLPFEWVRW
jgi:hypothetical protein